MNPRRAFTILELLVVIAIICILAALAIPAFNSIGRASNLSGTSQAVSGLLDLARQTASTQNRPVEVRFYKMPGAMEAATATPSVYRAIQAFLVDDASTNAVSRPTTLTSPVIISDAVAASSIMNDAQLPEKAADPSVLLSGIGANYRYRSFRFKPDGSTDLPTDSQWFFTLLSQTDTKGTNGLPANYVTIQIDPVTGRAKSYQP